MSSKILLLAAASLALAACNTTFGDINPSDPALGESVKYNAAVQTIDPDPVYDEGGSQPGDSGAKGAEAVKRYRTGQVTEVQQQTSSSSAGAGVGMGSGPN